jgi:hypothetical protein
MYNNDIPYVMANTKGAIVNKKTLQIKKRNSKF